MTQTILLVEDNDHNRLLFRDILVFHGYRVLEATNGAEGVRLAKAEQPDLILLDIQMPVMGGMKAAAMLRGDSTTKHLKIVALTSFAMQNDRDRIMAAGFDDYLIKPIDTRQLPLVVQQHLMTGSRDS